jgi:hypothetical protein
MADPIAPGPVIPPRPDPANRVPGPPVDDRHPAPSRNRLPKVASIRAEEWLRSVPRLASIRRTSGFVPGGKTPRDPAMRSGMGTEPAKCRSPSRNLKSQPDKALWLRCAVIMGSFRVEKWLRSVPIMGSFRRESGFDPAREWVRSDPRMGSIRRHGRPRAEVGPRLRGVGGTISRGLTMGDVPGTEGDPTGEGRSPIGPDLLPG